MTNNEQTPIPNTDEMRREREQIGQYLHRLGRGMERVGKLKRLVNDGTASEQAYSEAGTLHAVAEAVLDGTHWSQDWTDDLEIP